MQINKYIGDDKLQKMLDHYKCETPLSVIKMRFAGAICSPNLDLRPTDVISSFWLDGQTPRLETKDEADLFFKFFMGLWDEVFAAVKKNEVSLSFVKNKPQDLEAVCELRYAEVEMGYIEGFWGGKIDLQLPVYLAEIVDSLNDLASIYKVLAKRLDKGGDISEIAKTITHTDKMVEKAISFIIENSVLPRIDSLQKTVN